MKIISCEDVVDFILNLTTSCNSIYHELDGQAKFGFRTACQEIVDKLSDMDSLISENLLLQLRRTDDPLFMKVKYELTYNKLLLSQEDISYLILKEFQSAILKEKLKNREQGGSNNV